SPAGAQLVQMPFYVSSMNVGGLGFVSRVPGVGLPTNGRPENTAESNDRTPDPANAVRYLAFYIEILF
ncbi:MAG: hypothetical protein ABW276_08230, partial [Casimicrobiaceae bacterium]